jgi:hypothetical protein
MSRVATLERIDDARRAATRNSLIGAGVTEATADVTTPLAEQDRVRVR